MIKRNLEDAKEYALKNGAAKMIKQLMLNSNCSVQELAQALRIKPQSLSTKLYRDRFTFQEVRIITYLLEFEVAVLKDNKDNVRVY